MKILRSTILHTPRNAFRHADALAAYSDGALAVDNGRIVACADYAEVRAAHPDADVEDLRGGYILPGFIDTHVHFPQVRILGGLGYSLLDWLDQLTLPEEARLADSAYSSTIAREFTRALAAHGTTTALVFGSHFGDATASLLETANTRGLRVFAGIVLSDRKLRPELHQTAEAAYRDSKTLIQQFGADRYVVTPRFALSASEAILDVCQTLVGEHPGVRFTTHINESPNEIAEVARLFPWADDYLGVYERFNLVGPRSLLAHNIHASASELARLSLRGASVSHCPCSNAALGSGILPMRRHVEANVRVSLGSDVGGGTGFGILKEGLQAYLMQRLAAEPMTLAPAQMLYLATRAGAEALEIDDETGDFAPGKSADFVYLQAPENSVLAGVLGRLEDPERILAALFTMAGTESIKEVRVGDRDILH